MELFDLIPSATIESSLWFIIGVVLVTEIVKRTKKISKNYIPAVALVVAIAGAMYTGVGWTAGVLAALIASGLWDNVRMMLKTIKTK